PLATEILERTRAAGIDRDCGIAPGEDETQALRKLDGFLCELKDLQIRDGLHMFGESPEGERLDHLLLAIARARRGNAPEDQSPIRALAADLGLDDPLALDLAEPWTGPRPDLLLQEPPPQPSAACGGGSPGFGARHDPPPQAAEGWGGGWRTVGDTIERLEALALRLVSGAAAPSPEWNATR